MDQIVGTNESAYMPAKATAREPSFDREAIAFLGISRLQGVGFQTLFSLGGRAGIALPLELRTLTPPAVTGATSLAEQVQVDGPFAGLILGFPGHRRMIPGGGTPLPDGDSSPTTGSPIGERMSTRFALTGEGRAFG
jgi:hypothetical protein